MDALRWISKFPTTAYAAEFLNDLAIKVIKTGPVPKHIAIVMDGNRRYAKAKNVETIKGHHQGFATFLRIAQVCSALGVKALTVYAFSIENFNRGKEETDKLFEMVSSSLNGVTEAENSQASKFQWRIKVIGNRALIPPKLMADIEKVEANTANNTGMLVNICCPYTARDDMAQAMRHVAVEQPAAISEQAVEHTLYTAEGGPLDILIRTSGTTRLSDFLLWECVDGCQIEFASTLWPEFSVKDLYPILLRWGLRQINSHKGTIQLDKLPPAPAAVSVSQGPKV